MFKRFFKFFPPPQFLQMPAIGIDISDEAIRFIEFVERKQNLEIRRCGEKKMPAGIIDGGAIAKPKELESILNDIRREFGLHFIVSSLPEEKIFLFKTTIPSLNSKEIADNIELKMEENVPIAPSEVLFDYDVVERDTQSRKTSVSVSVAPEKVVQSYMEVFHDASLIPLSFETEGKAIARSVIHDEDARTYLIINFAERRTSFFIVSNHVVCFSSTISVGGADVNDLLKKKMGLTDEEVEAIKYDKGISKAKGGEKAMSAISDVLAEIKDEVNKILVYWNSHADNKNNKITKVLLCGKNGAIKGFDSYLATQVKTHVELANVWTNVFDFNVSVPRIEFTESLNYALAIGLTLGEFYKKYV